MFKAIASLCLVLGFTIAMAAQDRIVVSAQTAVLRGTPDAGGEMITTLQFLDSGELIATRGDWHLIQTRKYVGWIETRAVNKERGSNGPGIGTGQGGGMGTGSGNWRDAMKDGTGSGGGIGTGQGKLPTTTTPLKILSKPVGSYTTAARDKKVQGTVTLRITFLATGEIGTISVVKGLPNGLTEQAVNAAKRIRFEPAAADGVPRTVTKLMEYTFMIY